MKRGFTLIEIIFVVVISAILSVGAFKAMEALYLRSARAKAVTELSLRSQIVLDQLSQRLYNRVANSVVGYVKSDGTHSCESLKDTVETWRVLEWLELDEAHLVSGDYSGMADLNASSQNGLKTPDLNRSAFVHGIYNLIFAGSFDAGDEAVRACEGAYGWHGFDSNLSFDVDFPADGEISITDGVKPDVIYDKYYLTPGALAVARGADIDRNADCMDIALLDLGLSEKEINATLFLFYDYHPWRGETFCADPAGGDREGSVTILAKEVAGFDARYLNGVMVLKLDMNRTIRGSDGSGSVVHVTKQKAVF